MRCLTWGVLLGLCFFAALPATADEIWIAPGDKGDVAVGDWGLTPAGEAYFTFAVPDSLDRFVGAQVLVIGKKDRPITYDLHLSLSRDGESREAFTADATSLSANLDTDELTALDASSLFPALAPGEDVVALHFQASPQGDLRVVGLRFEFERFPDQAGLACGPREVLVGLRNTHVCAGRADKADHRPGERRHATGRDRGLLRRPRERQRGDHRRRRRPGAHLQRRQLRPRRRRPRLSGPPSWILGRPTGRPDFSIRDRLSRGVKKPESPNAHGRASGPGS